MDDLLQTLAELAVGITGFVGIVTTLRVTSADWDRIEAPRLGAMLFMSIGLMVFPILPLVLRDGLGLSAPFVVAGLVYALYCAVSMVVAIRWRVRGVGFWVFLRQPMRLLMSVTMVVLIPVMALANLAGHYWMGAPGNYLLMLALVFVFACYSFGRLMLVPRGGEAPPA